MGKSIDYYLERGYDRKAAEYFAGGRKKIIGVVPNNDFTLNISFDNGETRLYDVAPLMEPGTVFAELQDPENFHRVYLDDDHAVSWDIEPTADSSATWSNKIDLCPDSCYMDSVPIRRQK